MSAVLRLPSFDKGDPSALAQLSMSFDHRPLQLRVLNCPFSGCIQLSVNSFTPACIARHK